MVQHARLGGVDRVVGLLRELEIGGDVLGLDGDARDEDERGGGVERGHGWRFFLEALFFFFSSRDKNGLGKTCSNRIYVRFMFLYLRAILTLMSAIGRRNELHYVSKLLLCAFDHEYVL